MTMKVAIPAAKHGTAEITHFDVSEHDALMFNIRARARAINPGRYTSLKINGRLIMSDTPAEQRDHLQPVYKARGSVLINGLGIGMVTAACLKKRDVTDVTVIEINPDVIALVAPHIADKRLTVIASDALVWVPPKGKRYSMVWHDIWPDICTDNLPQMTLLKRRYGRRADWQGCWCEQQTRRDA